MGWSLGLVGSAGVCWGGEEGTGVLGGSPPIRLFFNSYSSSFFSLVSHYSNQQRPAQDEDWAVAWEEPGFGNQTGPRRPGKHGGPSLRAGSSSRALRQLHGALAEAKAQRGWLRM